MERKEIERRSGLDESSIEKLMQIEAILPLMADLAGSDLFIDCMEKSDGRMYVAAQAGPGHMPSAYENSVVGCFAEREDEPAIYRAVETRSPVRDIKAVTQESKIVRQDVVPISNERGNIIAVLIGEKDVSRDIRREQKYEALVRKNEWREAMPVSTEQAARREVHHRVKNHLQLIASMMNLQARKAESEEMRQAFRENTARILSIASINELLTADGQEEVSLKQFLERLRQNLTLLYDKGAFVSLALEGDELTVRQEMATDIALVVNELVSNAYKHAFQGQVSGTIKIILKKGERYSSVTVQDNGNGFTAGEDKKAGFGMDLVRMTVHDKLQGKLYVASNEHGSSITFDFLEL